MAHPPFLPLPAEESGFAPRWGYGHDYHWGWRLYLALQCLGHYSLRSSLAFSGQILGEDCYRRRSDSIPVGEGGLKNFHLEVAPTGL